MCDDAAREGQHMFLRGGKAPGGAEFSFIGPEVTVTGNIETEGRIHIDGRVVGDVRCGILSQGERGAVIGNIAAGEARLAGLVDGAVEAGGLALEGSARVTGDVLYESVSITRGAEVEGRFKRRKAPGDGSAGAKVEAAGAGAEKARPPQARSDLAELFPAAQQPEAAE
jgi:cytoskeletal protein CcmA (bactofilin family)